MALAGAPNFRFHKTLASAASSSTADWDPHAGSLASAEGPVDLGILVMSKKGPLAWVVLVAKTAPPPDRKAAKNRGETGAVG